jgi:hypothetical protein
MKPKKVIAQFGYTRICTSDAYNYRIEVYSKGAWHFVGFSRSFIGCVIKIQSKGLVTNRNLIMDMEMWSNRLLKAN